MMRANGQRAVIRPITNRLVLIKFHLDDLIEKINEHDLQQEADSLREIAKKIDELKSSVHDHLLEKLSLEK